LVTANPRTFEAVFADGQRREIPATGAFLGRDRLGNYYWNGYPWINIFRPDGSVVKAIQVNRPSLGTRTQARVNQDGIVYIFEYNYEAYDFERGRLDLYRVDTGMVPEDLRTPVVQTRTGTSTVNRLRIRTKPNLQSDTVGHLSEGQQVTIIDQTNEPMQIGEMNDVWYKIRTEDAVEGWSYGGLIEVE
jgi:hypothetical protein